MFISANLTSTERGMYINQISSSIKNTQNLKGTLLGFKETTFESQKRMKKLISSLGACMLVTLGLYGLLMILDKKESSLKKCIYTILILFNCLITMIITSQVFQIIKMNIYYQEVRSNIDFKSERDNISNIKDNVLKNIEDLYDLYGSISQISLTEINQILQGIRVMEDFLDKDHNIDQLLSSMKDIGKLINKYTDVFSSFKIGDISKLLDSTKYLDSMASVMSIIETLQEINIRDISSIINNLQNLSENVINFMNYLHSLNIMNLSDVKKIINLPHEIIKIGNAFYSLTDLIKEEVLEDITNSFVKDIQYLQNIPLSMNSNILDLIPHLFTEYEINAQDLNLINEKKNIYDNIHRSPITENPEGCEFVFDIKNNHEYVYQQDFNGIYIQDSHRRKILQAVPINQKEIRKGLKISINVNIDYALKKIHYFETVQNMLNLTPLSKLQKIKLLQNMQIAQMHNHNYVSFFEDKQIIVPENIINCIFENVNDDQYSVIYSAITSR